MAGILFNSASKTMVSGDTSPVKSITGAVVQEQVALSTFPAGTDHVWSMAIPSGSAAARSALSDTTAAGPLFTPDAAGSYVLTCLVDSTTTYSMLVAVAAVTIAESVQAARYQPLANSVIPTPSLGETLFESEDNGRLSVKVASTGIVYALARAGSGSIVATTRLINTSSPYTVLSTDCCIFCDTDAGAITVLLPAGVDGTGYTVINTGSAGNDVTLTPNGTEQINAGGAGVSQTITDGNAAGITFETTENWWAR